MITAVAIAMLHEASSYEAYMRAVWLYRDISLLLGTITEVKS